MRLTPDDPAAIRQRMDDLMARRRASQPLEWPSAGSTFKRPEGYFAGTLIDQTGLKGLTVGGAQVSEKHAGFVINTGNATCADVQELIRRVKKQHYDATHNCWAYIIRDGAVRFSDDGEPGGTAGMPMLQVLQREGLFNVVCVVTRYFGGILLGAGGLVRAYTKGAKIAVDAAGKSMKRVWTVLYLPCPYSWYERVKLETESCGGIIRSTDFGSEVELELLFPEAKTPEFLEKLTDMTAGTVEAMETGTEYRAFPI